MRPYYLDYSAHMLRLWCKLRDMSTAEVINRIKTDADRESWNACSKVWPCLTEQERDVVVAVFSAKSRDTRAAVDDYACANATEAKAVWHVCRSVMERVARERGLL